VKHSFRVFLARLAPLRLLRPLRLGEKPVKVRRLAVLASAAALVMGVGSLVPVQAGSVTDTVKTLLGHLACSPLLGRSACYAQVVTNAQALAAEPHAGSGAPAGYGPADLRSAYNLTSLGAGHTVAIVDAFDDPSAEADLAVYRSQFGLGACTTANGCFKKVDQNGGSNYPAADAGWATEISLDVQMVSAVCPLCHILLVEGSAATSAALDKAVDTAARMGASAISNSYGASESASQVTADDPHYNHPGIAVTVSSGDSGYGVQYPASSPYVTAVGGTTLTRGSGGWSESAWSGAGSGCSAYEGKPAWQKDAGCPNRTVADVSAVADPATGVAVYDTYGATPGNPTLCALLGINCPVAGGWLVVGGTSVSSPIIASVYTLAGNAVTSGSYPYGHTGSLNDVTTGSNGGGNPGILGLLGTPNCGSYLCNAGPGYDGPTGWGTPNGTLAF
jgi:subtilase family serine protease